MEESPGFESHPYTPLEGVFLQPVQFPSSRKTGGLGISTHYECVCPLKGSWPLQGVFMLLFVEIGASTQHDPDQELADNIRCVDKLIVLSNINMPYSPTGKWNLLKSTYKDKTFVKQHI